MRRRSVLIGLAAILVAAGGATWKFNLFGPHYPPTPYDDLLGQLADRKPAAIFGRAALKDGPAQSAARLAAGLRKDGRTLSSRAASEPGEAQVTEVAGWVVPQSVAQFSALAAKTTVQTRAD
jgi:hypothetical protein